MEKRGDVKDGLDIGSERDTKTRTDKHGRILVPSIWNK